MPKKKSGSNFPALKQLLTDFESELKRSRLTTDELCELTGIVMGLEEILSNMDSDD